MGVGPAELIIVALILLVLFGPTLVAFFLGYTLGKKKAAATPGAANTPASPDTDAPAAGEHHVAGAPQEPAAEVPSASPEAQETLIDE